MKRLIQLAVLLLTALAICWPAQALIINIPADQPTIQAGIDAAVAGDTVLVADGTYYENIDFLGKAITVTSVNGPASTTIDGGGTGYVVIFQSFEGPDSVIERFTITNGTPGVRCLGHYPDESVSPTIRNNIITGNTGWGISCEFSAPLIEENLITENNGGGIACHLSNARIDRNEISNHFLDSPYGGAGISCTTSNGVITRNVITGNVAGKGGGLRLASGVYAIGNVLVLADNQISGNTAVFDGGGVYLESHTTLDIRNNVISDNEAGNKGGGIFKRGGWPLTIAANRVSGNSADEGGGIYCEDEAVSIINNLISYNTARLKGGGIRLGSSATIDSNTIIHNQAIDEHGGGIHSWSNNVTLTNNILFFNSAVSPISKEVRWGRGGTIEFNHCVVEGGLSSVFIDDFDLEGLIWGTGMIETDPLLIDGPYGQACLSQVASGQATDSPCLDAGSVLATAVSYDTSLGTVTMDQLTTRTDQLADSSTVDLGWHSQGWPSNTVAAWMSGTPESGTLPFQVQFTAGLINRYLVQTRRLAVKVDVTLASGGHFASWRAGYTNLDRGETFTRTWAQNFPALGTLVGVNQFSLTAVDVTPAPFNQPPYPPSGDTATGSCTVTAAAP